MVWTHIFATKQTVRDKFCFFTELIAHKIIR